MDAVAEAATNGHGAAATRVLPCNEVWDARGHAHVCSLEPEHLDAHHCNRAGCPEQKAR